jgi:hypothetical protein
MRRISRFGLAVLALNLTLVGQELVCAHEAAALEQPAHTDHGASTPHEQSLPPDRDEPPCDESAPRCCDAIASCAIAGVPGQVLRDDGPARPEAALIAVTQRHLVNAPLEVATPPPRR